MCLIFFSSKGENQIFLFLEEEPPKRWDRGVWHFSKVGNQPRWNYFHYIISQNENAIKIMAYYWVLHHYHQPPLSP